MIEAQLTPAGSVLDFGLPARLARHDKLRPKCDTLGMAGSDDRTERRHLLLGITLYGAIAVSMLLDLVADVIDVAHFVMEGLIMILAAAGMTALARRLLVLAREQRRLEGERDELAAQRDALAHQLASARAEGERWRAEARHILDGLAAAIDEQFASWGLTAAESQVALFLLKGLSLKEIANMREVSERTVRQQAQSVYRKAGLSGRADLSAFFLEDLMLPSASTTLDDARQGRRDSNPGSEP